MPGIGRIGDRTEETVTYRSSDGTGIGCHRTGSGPALVVVHGTAADHSSWTAVTPLLASTLTIYAMDRRGRGASGDSTAYQLDREIEDIVAVVEGIGARGSTSTATRSAVRAPPRPRPDFATSRA